MKSASEYWNKTLDNDITRQYLALLISRVVGIYSIVVLRKHRLKPARLCARDVS